MLGCGLPKLNANGNNNLPTTIMQSSVDNMKCGNLTKNTT